MKVDVLVPTYRGVNSNSYAAITAMLEYSRGAKVKGQRLDIHQAPVKSNGLIHHVRNHAAESVRKNADFVLWCDDDMMPNPDDLVRLLQHNAPVVSALTTTRGSLPVKYTVKAYDRDADMFTQVDEMPEGKCIQGELGIGTGFVVMRKSILDDAKQRYLDGVDWMTDNEAILKGAGASDEVIDKARLEVVARRKGMEAIKEPPNLFRYAITKSGYQLGEDISFIRDLILAGVPIAVDTTVQVGHIGDFPYGPWNVGQEKYEEVKL